MSEQPSKEAMEAARRLDSESLVSRDWEIVDTQGVTLCQAHYARIVDEAFAARCKDCKELKRLRELCQRIYGTLECYFEPETDVDHEQWRDLVDDYHKALAETGEGEEKP